jgi:hypothetical protein
MGVFVLVEAQEAVIDLEGLGFGGGEIHLVQQVLVSKIAPFSLARSCFTQESRSTIYSPGVSSDHSFLRTRISE